MVKSQKLSSKIKSVCLIATYLVPILLLILFIDYTTENVPHSDDWLLVPLFEQVAQGKATFASFFALANEHRLFFPRLVFVALAFLTQWNLKAQMLVSVALTIVASIGLYQLSQWRRRRQSRLFHLCNLLSVLLIFSITQWDWLWGYQLAWYLINSCVILAIFTLTVSERFSPKLRLAIASGLCIIASFSSAQGLFSWIALIPSVINLEGKLKVKLLRCVLWLLIGSAAVAIYLVGYEKPISHPDPWLFLKQPELAAKFFLAMAGTPIGVSPFALTVSMGLLVIGGFLLANLFWLQRFHSQLATDISPWLSLGWFSAIFIFVTTLSRLGFGLELAVSGHYIGVSMLLWVSCLQIWRIFIESDLQPLFRTKIAYGLTGLLLFLLLKFNYQHFLTSFDYKIHIRAGGTCIQIINFLDNSYNTVITSILDKQPKNCLQSILYNPTLLRELAVKLDSLNFREFVQQATFMESPEIPVGEIELWQDRTIVLKQSQALELAGWAIAPSEQQQPDIVLFSYGKNQSFFADAEINVERPAVAQAKHAQRLKIGWRTYAPLKSLPIGETTVKAWIYDPMRQRFLKLKGRIKLKVMAA